MRKSKSKSSAKPDFVRTDISRNEKLLGVGILVLLGGIGVAVAIKGRVYDPAKFSVDPANLEFTRAAVTGKAATLRTDDGMRSFETSSPATAGEAGELAPPVAGMEPLGPTEHYTPETLYEKINGRAPAYTEFGFQELTARSFGIPGQPGQYLDVFVFTMDNPVNAFGIFSMERGSEATMVDFAPDGYRSEMGYFFRQGSAYVQVLASDVAETVMAPAEQAARALAVRISADDTGIAARTKLPAADQVPGSVSFIRQNAYGQAALENTFEARYTAGDRELTYFAMVAEPDKAAAAFDALKAFYTDFGTVQESGELAGDRFFVGESFGQVSVIHTDGQTVAGVMNADDGPLARSFVERILAPATPEDEYSEH